LSATTNCLVPKAYLLAPIAGRRCEHSVHAADKR
jgi:hypothetical protein